MNKSVVCIYDLRAEQFISPRLECENNTAVALRNFQNGVQAAYKQQDSVFYSNPEDFELRLIGYFDDETGVFEPVIPNEVIGRAKDVYIDEA